MSIAAIAQKWARFQDNVGSGFLEHMQYETKINKLFDKILNARLPEEDMERILHLHCGITFHSHTQHLQSIFLILLRNCPDSTIQSHLDLDSWGSQGNVQEAKRKILQCVKNRETLLDLSWLGLTSLPDGIGKLVHLQELNCSHNNLDVLSANLLSLSRTRLLFSHNRISHLPEVLYDLDIDFSHQRASSSSLRANQTVLTGPYPLGHPYYILNICYPHLTNHSPQTYVSPTRPELDAFKNAVSEERLDLKYLEIPSLIEDEVVWPTFLEWLDKLQTAADFIKSSTRQLTAERVLSILQLAEENLSYRETASAILQEAATSCTDRATLPLCPLEIQKAIIETGDSSIDHMLYVLKGAFAAELLFECAWEYLQIKPADDVEVYLGLQVELKEEFHLPIGVRRMDHFKYSNMDNSDILSAKHKVYQRLNNHERYLAFLLAQKPWTQKIQKEFAEERASVLADSEQAMIQLDDQLFDGSLNSLEYETKAHEIKKQREAVEAQWLKTKTEQICFPMGLHASDTVIIVKCPYLPSNASLFIRGNMPGLEWTRGVKLERLDWETFTYKTSIPFSGELDYKLLINDDQRKYEEGPNHKITSGKTVERAHTFNKAYLPPLQKTILSIHFPVQRRETLHLSGTGPLGYWNQKVPMHTDDNGNWFISFDGQFPPFEYKLRLGDRWEQGADHWAECGKSQMLNAPVF